MRKNASRTLTYEQAMLRLTSLCSTSEHCQSDVREKLYKWGLSRGDSEKIIDYLLDEKYIDEYRYANAYANDKLRFSHWGRAKIRSMLYMQHIPEACINEALDNIDEAEYERILESVLEGKKRTLPECESYASRVKIIRFALQRGFEMGEITKFIGEY
ncbi:MAG: RecX family transcriptional regulator [Bacteroidaceae bacterium]|nr:RecX family transcriptional regulator [Bacteroidaceae bacterium]